MYMQRLAPYALYIVVNERVNVGFCSLLSLVYVYIIPYRHPYININLLKIFKFTNC